jgi:histidine triad (HIT) family protein
LIPKKHAENILDLTREEYVDLMIAAKELSELMRIHFSVPRIALIVEGMSVPHIHVHLIPVSKKGQLGDFPRYPLNADDLAELGEQLRGSQ